MGNVLSAFFYPNFSLALDLCLSVAPSPLLLSSLVQVKSIRYLFLLCCGFRTQLFRESHLPGKKKPFTRARKYAIESINFLFFQTEITLITQEYNKNSLLLFVPCP